MKTSVFRSQAGNIHFGSKSGNRELMLTSVESSLMELAPESSEIVGLNPEQRTQFLDKVAEGALSLEDVLYVPEEWTKQD